MERYGHLPLAPVCAQLVIEENKGYNCLEALSRVLFKACCVGTTESNGKCSRLVYGDIQLAIDNVDSKMA